MLAAVSLAASSSRSTVSRAPSRAPSSRSSFMVKAACIAPRRPTTLTARAAGRPTSAASAARFTSVASRSHGCAARILAQSSATLPWPMTTARQTRASSPLAAPASRPIGLSRANVGSLLYQPTNERADRTPSRPVPGSSSAASPRAPHATTTLSKDARRVASDTTCGPPNACRGPKPPSETSALEPTTKFPTKENFGDDATDSKSRATLFTSG
mmetsp:Transcript_30438/g.100748  ORF Transcript_30438/g.100748 Transcript_30438/m.100748 type:complete len:214 (+) Transcript_30438:690-1331(+)